MEITDIVLLILIGAFAVRGLIKGLVHELFGIGAIIIGYIAAYKYSLTVGSLFKSFDLSEKSLSALGFVIVFIVTYLVVMIIAVFIGKIIKNVSLSDVNRGGGMVFGAFKAAVILSVILTSFVSFMPKESGFVKTTEKGAVSGFLIKLSPVIYDIVNKFGGSHVNPFREEKIELEPVDIFGGDPGQKALEKVKESAGNIRDGAEEKSGDIMDKVKNMTREEKDALAEKLLAPKADQ
ncbi:CvpA family protein [Geovibrio ferrireducens]|uniref:CvpA family protein n=1 Tax=Geovibrio ferrireducens TaxID=46201 RepID=UPI002246C1DD|nr:CvpA family protein [Geovibrio ferrireducens]